MIEIHLIFDEEVDNGDNDFDATKIVEYANQLNLDTAHDWSSYTGYRIVDEGGNLVTPSEFLK